MSKVPGPRARRSQCYWEPIYNPALVGKLRSRDWDFTKDAGPVESFLDLSNIQPYIAAGGSRIFKHVRFRDCDFQGVSSNTAQVVFEKCEFIGCDFSLSTFVKFKFARCSFERCSFGQATLIDVEFRDCRWKEIAASSNETVLEKVYVSNPGAFNNALWTQLDKEILESRKVIPSYQWFRHELSKATIARTLLNNHRTIGDDGTFYESVRVFETQQAYSKACRAFYSVRDGVMTAPWFIAKGVFWFTELALLWIFGLLNAWGASALRPLLALVLLFVGGGFFYRVFFGREVSFPFQASFDVTMIAGYTKAVPLDATQALQGAFSAHLILALIMYSVFFATIVARLSRVR